jgi:hypothetical protein
LRDDLKWSEESAPLNQTQFKSLMRLELRKSVSSQYVAK